MIFTLILNKIWKLLVNYLLSKLCLTFFIPGNPCHNKITFCSLVGILLHTYKDTCFGVYGCLCFYSVFYDCIFVQPCWSICAVILTKFEKKINHHLYTIVYCEIGSTNGSIWPIKCNRKRRYKHASSKHQSRYLRKQ